MATETRDAQTEPSQIESMNLLLAGTLQFFGRWEEMKELLDTFEPAQSPRNAANHCLLRAAVEWALGTPSDTLTFTDRALDHARRSGNPHLVGSALKSKGVFLHSLGRLDEAQQILEGVVADAEQHGRDWQALVARHHLGFLFADTGRYREARPVLQAMVASASALRAPHLEAMGLSIQAQVHVHENELPQARDLCERAVAWLDTLGNPPEAFTMVGWTRVQLDMAAGDYEAACTTLQELRSFAGTHGGTLALVRVESSLAVTLFLMGRAERSLHVFGSADACSLGRRVSERCVLLASYAVALMEVGHRARARACLEEAWAVAEALGPAVFLNLCGTVSKALDVPPPRRVPKGAPDSHPCRMVRRMLRA